MIDYCSIYGEVMQGFYSINEVLTLNNYYESSWTIVSFLSFNESNLKDTY